MRRLLPALAGMLVLAGCAADRPPSEHVASGPLASHARAFSDAHGVPADLVLAIGVVETGVKLPRWRVVDADADVPVAGILELRRGAFDSLGRGAALARASEMDLRTDTNLGTEAGILVLAELAKGADPSDLASFADAVGTLSGYRDSFHRAEYVARVFRTLRLGGSFPARSGETITIPPHPEIPVGMTIAPPGSHLLGTPDSPVVTQWVDTPMTGTPTSTGCTNKWDTSHDGKSYVVIHDTEGGWDASLSTLQNDGCKSVHYMIDADGSRVAQFLPETTVAYHAGNYWYNQRAIGIEHVGTASDPAGYSDALYAKSVELVKDITSRNSIPVDRDHIFGHYQVPNGNNISESSPPCGDGLDPCETSPNYGGAGNHRDPGYHWQWCQYMEWLGGTCACNDAWALWNCTTDGAEVWRCDNGNLEKMDCSGGCTVMPVGTPDACVATAGSGGAGGSTGAGGNGDAGAAGTSSGGSPAGGSSSGGSSAGGSSSGGSAGGPSAGGSAGSGASGGASPSAGGAGASTSPGGGSTVGAAGSGGSGASVGSAGAGGSQAPTQVIVGSPSESGGCSISHANDGSALAFLTVLAALGASRRRRGGGAEVARGLRSLSDDEGA